jgi:hypothetical protein
MVADSIRNLHQRGATSGQIDEAETLVTVSRQGQFAQLGALGGLLGAD